MTEIVSDEESSYYDSEYDSEDETDQEERKASEPPKQSVRKSTQPSYGLRQSSTMQEDDDVVSSDSDSELNDQQYRSFVEKYGH